MLARLKSKFQLALQLSCYVILGKFLQIENELNEAYLCTIVRIKYAISNV